jgi:hypothetical protein
MFNMRQVEVASNVKPEINNENQDAPKPRRGDRNDNTHPSWRLKQWNKLNWNYFSVIYSSGTQLGFF